MKPDKPKPQRRAEPSDYVPSSAAKIVYQKARDREANKILRGNTQIANNLERQAGFSFRKPDLHDRIAALLMREAAAALRQSDRVRPDLPLDYSAKPDELDEARQRGTGERAVEQDEGRTTESGAVDRIWFRPTT